MALFLNRFVVPAVQAVKDGQGPDHAYLELTFRVEAGMRSVYVELVPGCGADIRFLLTAWNKALRHSYFNLGYRKRDLGPCIRGGAGEVVGIPGLWLDIDLVTGVHAKTALPGSVDEALELLHDALPGQPPTDLVHSGGGLHAYWLFDRPWYFQDEGERADASRQLKGLHARVQAVAAQRGWHLDNVADLPRMLRVPGTYNAKDPQNPKLAVFIQ